MTMIDEALMDGSVRARDRSSELLLLYHITEEDLERIRRYGTLLGRRLDLYVEKFYEWLGVLPEFARFFGDKVRLERVKSLQLTYWGEFFRVAATVACCSSRDELEQLTETFRAKVIEKHVSPSTAGSR